MNTKTTNRLIVENISQVGYNDQSKKVYLFFMMRKTKRSLFQSFILDLSTISVVKQKGKTILESPYKDFTFVIDKGAFKDDLSFIETYKNRVENGDCPKTVATELAAILSKNLSAPIRATYVRDC